MGDKGIAKKRNIVHGWFWIVFCVPVDGMDGLCVWGWYIRDHYIISQLICRRSSILDWLVEQSGDELLAVALCRREHHDAVLDGERVHVVEHHVVRLRQHVRIARFRSFLVEQNLLRE